MLQSENGFISRTSAVEEQLDVRNKLVHEAESYGWKIVEATYDGLGHYDTDSIVENGVDGTASDVNE